MFNSYEKRKGDGGYWINELDSNYKLAWTFVGDVKTHDEEGGMGYFITDFDGNSTYMEYVKRYTEDGYYVTTIEEEEVFYEFPKEKVTEEESEEDFFNLEAAEEEAEEDERAKAEAELAGRIVGVAETGMKRREDI